MRLRQVATVRSDTPDREVFEESMEIIRRALDNESFSFQGKHFSLPVPGIPDRYQGAEGPLHQLTDRRDDTFHKTSFGAGHARAAAAHLVVRAAEPPRAGRRVHHPPAGGAGRGHGHPGERAGGRAPWRPRPAQPDLGARAARCRDRR